MPKDSRARTLAVRKVMEETGLSYNKAAHELDRRTAAEQSAPRTDEQRLHVVPFVVYCTVPSGADRGELAQDLADRLHMLRRKETGEEYEGRADVIVPASPWAPEPRLSGYVEALLLVHAWAVRPWDRKGETEAVISDFFAAARAWVTERYPAVPVEGHPVALPLGRAQAEALAAGAAFTAHTAGAHTNLPEGWEELIAARRAEVASGRASEPPVTGALAQGSVLAVPNAPGGAQKTVAAVSLPLPPHRPVDLDSGPPRPYRVVDHGFQGWFRRGGDGLYDADRGHARGLESMTYEELEAARGPLRPVEPPSAEEAAAVKATLAGAGRKAAATVLVALYRLVLQDAQAARSGGPRNRLVAGREGSWESEALVRLAWNVGADLAEKAARFDEAAVTELVRVVEGWVSAPGRYTEVAATLAGAFSAVADEAGDWAAVADRYLQRHQRVGHPDHVVEAVQHYLMSQSASFFA